MCLALAVLPSPSGTMLLPLQSTHARSTSLLPAVERLLETFPRCKPGWVRKARLFPRCPTASYCEITEQIDADEHVGQREGQSVLSQPD